MRRKLADMKCPPVKCVLSYPQWTSFLVAADERKDGEGINDDCPELIHAWKCVRGLDTAAQCVRPQLASLSRLGSTGVPAAIG